MSIPRPVVTAIVACAIAALATMVPRTRAEEDAAPAPAAPLTNEDIVRMVASGEDERDILDAIRTHAEAFDLSGDMVEELRLAGIPATVLAAMRQRHAELSPPAPPTTRARQGRVPIVVTLNTGTLRVPAWADEDAKQRFQLPKENDQRQVKDLAVFLACVTSEHVPDMWRSKSPLGRDMSSVVRHEMLSFVAGDTAAGTEPQLVLPARLEGEIDEGEPHDLVLGVAARIGDRWVQLGVGRILKTTIAAGGKPLVGRIKHVGHGFTFAVELVAPR
jgi:hypothetical protein